MSTLTVKQSPSPTEHVDQCVSELHAARERLSATSLNERRALLEDCLDRLMQVSPEWVEAACEAKGIPAGSPMRAEEIANGPVATARHLRLLIDNYRSIEQNGHIVLPAAPKQLPDGSLGVQVMPVRGLFDSLVFAGFKATAVLGPEVTRQELDRLGSHLQSLAPAKTVLVLGAGNVSSIPATDAVSKIFQEGHVVLLKMNPVNEYLGPIFQRLFARLVDYGYVRIIYGGADVGAAAVEHAGVDEVHITGSIHSHDAIVWGPPGPDRERRKRENDPVLKKPITSELGNVSPWIIVPGPYSEAQLKFQAENVAASIANNASFNCVATKMIVTWENWPQRQHFLDLVNDVLGRVPPRKAYYPGARERFEKFTGRAAPDDSSGTLPWTLMRDTDPERAPQLFCEESFVCVCAETSLAADNERDFVDRAVEFANENLWGTLSAAITVHPTFRRDPAGAACFNAALSNLRHGAVGVNHWPALVYAMMSPPWGGYPSTALANVQSGIGSVHNTFMLQHVLKTVLEGPISIWPKPFWFPTHRDPEPIAWKVLGLYHQPSVWKLPALVLSSLRG